MTSRRPRLFAYGITVAVAAILCAGSVHRRQVAPRSPGRGGSHVRSGWCSCRSRELHRWCRPQTGPGPPRPRCHCRCVTSACSLARGLPLEPPAVRRAHLLLGDCGTLQAVAFPDLSTTFPHLVWFQYTAGHLGIVFAALFLVVGMGLKPRKEQSSGSLRSPSVHARSWAWSTGFGGELHVPATGACGVDPPQGPRTLALVHLQCGGSCDRPDHGSRRPVLAFAAVTTRISGCYDRIPTVKRVPRGPHGEEPGG